LRAPIQVLDSPGMMPCFRYSHQSRAGKNDPQTPRGLLKEPAATKESSRGRSPRPRPRSQPSPIESAWQNTPSTTKRPPRRRPPRLYPT
jgi:hypothetical protein